jgi:aldehyde:ferredoxin oxidoreductase
MGGHWGAELKFAGYDHLVIHGRSENPVYVAIQDDNVEIRDAKNTCGA